MSARAALEIAQDRIRKVRDEDRYAGEKNPERSWSARGLDKAIAIIHLMLAEEPDNPISPARSRRVVRREHPGKGRVR